MSRILTLINVIPTLFNSGVTESRIFSRNLSLSAFISSIVKPDTTERSCPNIISDACSTICCCVSPNSLSAAFCIKSGNELTPIVKVDGIEIRMFCSDNAFFKSMSIDIGVKSKKLYPWKTGMINVPPP